MQCCLLGLECCNTAESLQSYHGEFFKVLQQFGLLGPASERRDAAAWPAGLCRVLEPVLGGRSDEQDCLWDDEVLQRVSLLGSADFPSI